MEPVVSFAPGVEPPPDGDGVSGEELEPFPVEEAPPLEIGGVKGWEFPQSFPQVQLDVPDLQDVGVAVEF